MEHVDFSPLHSDFFPQSETVVYRADMCYVLRQTIDCCSFTHKCIMLLKNVYSINTFDS